MLDMRDEEAQDEDKSDVRAGGIKVRDRHRYIKTCALLGIFLRPGQPYGSGWAMVVRTRQNGQEVTGLRVGAANVRRYFPKTVSRVKLRLGDLEIDCKLSPEFWHGKPEIEDPRLCEWLKFRRQRDESDRKPVTLTLDYAGGDAYTLQATAPWRF